MEQDTSVKYFWCENCGGMTVSCSRVGEPYHFCRECKDLWLEREMLHDGNVKRITPPDVRKPSTTPPV